MFTHHGDAKGEIRGDHPLHADLGANEQHRHWTLHRRIYNKDKSDLEYRIAVKCDGD